VLTTAARFVEPWEAHLFRMLLEAEGLFAVVAFDQHAWNNYSISWAIGGVRVQVVKAELERALDIERRCRAGEYSAALEAEFGPLDLPSRTAGSSARRGADIAFSCLISLLAALTFGAVIPIRAGRRDKSIQ
jgi:hypothetical protein